MVTHTRNTDPDFWSGTRRDCNCGSFALNLREWYRPYEMYYSYDDRANRIVELAHEGLSDVEVADILAEEEAGYMLEEFPELLTPISYEEMLETDPEAEIIAYRVGVEFFYDPEEICDSDDFDDDFHFKVRRGGQWLEKRGETDVRKCELLPDKIWERNNGIYNSKIIYFKVDRSKEQ